MEAADVRGMLGLLLTDGALQHYPTPAGGYVQLTLTCGQKSTAFLEEKVAEINHFMATEAQITPYEGKPTKKGEPYVGHRFRISTNRLRPIYNLLYPAGKRCITQTALDMLGGHAAAWTWATGARITCNGGALLSRIGRTTEEAELISNWLELLTGAASTIDTAARQPRLLYSPAEAHKIRGALLAYAPLTRKHLFTGVIPDDSKIRSARTQLLLGEWETLFEGAQEKALAGAAQA